MGLNDNLGNSSALAEPTQDIPSTQDASNAFNAMIDNMVEEILTCQKCFLSGHFENNWPSSMVCLACSRVGHNRRDCERIAREQGLFWKPKYPPASPVPNTSLEVAAPSVLVQARDSSCSPARAVLSIHCSSPPKTPIRLPCGDAAATIAAAYTCSRATHGCLCS